MSGFKKKGGSEHWECSRAVKKGSGDDTTGQTEVSVKEVLPHQSGGVRGRKKEPRPLSSARPAPPSNEH